MTRNVTTSTVYLHPLDRRRLTAHSDGHLYDSEGLLVFKGDRGSYDFVVGAEDERAHYDNEYVNGGPNPARESLDTLDYNVLWDEEPWSAEYLNSIGDVRGKQVLLIGNGTSVKEFLFVKLGARLTFTDLSFQGVSYARKRYAESRLGSENPCEFHAVNAYHLPFEDNAYDVICADAVIHHLEDLKTLFAGIYRCLKLGGICRFADTAYSPLWQRAKRGILRPLQVYTHLKYGISPEDRKATERGGYTRKEIEGLQKELGFSRLYYKRVALLDYLLWRARCKLNAPWLLAVRPIVRGLDRLLANTSIMESQGIGLVFGFDK